MDLAGAGRPRPLGCCDAAFSIITAALLGLAASAVAGVRG